MELGTGNLSIDADGDGDVIVIGGYLVEEDDGNLTITADNSGSILIDGTLSAGVERLLSTAQVASEWHGHTEAPDQG